MHLKKGPIISKEPMGLPAAISQLTVFFVFDKRLNVGNLEKGRWGMTIVLTARQPL